MRLTPKPHQLSYLIIAALSFAAISLGLFLPSAPVLILFSLYLPVIALTESLGQAPAAFMLTGISSFLGLISMSRLPGGESLVLPVLLLALWGDVFIIHLHAERLKDRLKKTNEERERIQLEMVSITKEVDFYQIRQGDLTRTAEQRRFLVRVARELGSLLDPQEIQIRLVDSAQMLFPQKRVSISYGQTNDPVDQFVIHKRQPVQIPNAAMKGPPMLAAPITAQNAVAGVLKVAGEGEAPFSRDALRLLDVLASLASLALDNVVLFRRVQETALRDGLTGLLTHRAFQERLEAEILEASRFGHVMSVILTDIDHFKSVNDTYGHQTGDQVLVGYTQALSRRVRDIDVLARYGGEEFIILLPHLSHMDAMAAAEEMRREVENRVFESEFKPIRITGSFGVAAFPQDATSAQQLIRHADQRLYRAKEEGRNQVRGR